MPLRQVGKYEILSELGSGGMAKVFLARSSGLGGFERLVALKTIHPEMANDPASVAMFLDDTDTSGIIVIGEIGGTDEEDVANLIAARKPAKPVVALIAGRHAPPERRMGHAGALATQGSGSAADKIRSLEQAGVHVVADASRVGAAMREALL